MRLQSAIMVAVSTFHVQHQTGFCERNYLGKFVTYIYIFVQ
jgi:hypothetical protein